MSLFTNSPRQSTAIHQNLQDLFMKTKKMSSILKKAKDEAYETREKVSEQIFDEGARNIWDSISGPVTTHLRVSFSKTFDAQF
jgi:hypothetical protein